MPGFNPGIIVSAPSLPSIVGMPGSEPRHGKRSRVLVYAGAVTCGVLAALALQIYLSAAGFDLGALWEDLMAARAAVAYHRAVVGDCGDGVRREWRDCRRPVPPPLPVASFSPPAVGLGSRDRSPARACRPFRRGRDGVLGPGANVAVRLAAFGLAGLTAMLGAYLAVRR